MFSSIDSILHEQNLSLDRVPSLQEWQQFLTKLDTQRQIEKNAYDTLMNHRDEAVFLFDLSFRIVKANSAATKLLRYENPDDLVGHNAEKHLSAENWADAQERIKRLLDGEDVPAYERVLQSPDGTIVYTLSSIKLIRDANGLPLYVQSRLTDISQQKSMEFALEKKESYLRTILNNLPIILWACDENTILQFSEGNGLAKLGIKPNANVGQSILSLYGHFPQVKASIEKALSGQASDIQISLGGREYDSRYRPIVENGKIKGAVGLAVDITELVYAQKAVQAEQAESSRVREFIETILNTSSDGIAVLDSLGRIQQNNPAFDKLFQSSSDVNFNTIFLKLFTDDSQAELEDAIGKAFQNQKASRLELQALASDKSIFYADINLSPIIHKEKELSAIVCSIRDISSYKALQQNLATARDNAIEIARLKTEFLAVMSHEIRTPLNAILGLLEIMHDTTLDSNQLELISIMKDQGEILRYLINNVLDYSKLGADKMILEHRDFNLKKMLQKLSQQYYLEAKKKDVEFILLVDETIPENIRGDAHRLRQVLSIFLSNALKFTHGGQIKLLVSNRDSLIEFCVVDTGIGIPEEAKSHLFEPFTQVDSSHTRRYGGTGLGLAIAQKIIRLMGSEILVESKVGQGTSFIFCLAYY